MVRNENGRLRWAAIEIVCALAAMSLIAILIVPRDTLPELRPHPFALVVLVASLQYGTMAGLIATSLALTAQWLIGWPPQAATEDHFAYLARTWGEPSMWLALSLLVGELRDRQLQENATLTDAAATANADRTLLADRCLALTDRLQQAEHGLVETPLLRVRDAIEALSRLASPDRHERDQALATGGKLLLGAHRLSLWSMRGGELSLHASAGWNDAGRWRELFRVGDPLYEAMIRQSGVLSVRRSGDRPRLDGQGLLAVPVVCPATAVVVGMMKIEGADPSCLDPDHERILAAVARLLRLADPVWPEAGIASTGGEAGA